MPRFWFVSEDEVSLIQVQKSAFLLNWRRRNAKYPHFAEHLKPGFDKYYGVFKEFLRYDVGMGGPEISHCELTYVNVIMSSDYWQGPYDTSRVIRSFAIPNHESGHDTVPAFNCVYQYEVELNLQLHVTIRTAKTANPLGSPLLILEFKALGQPDDVSTSKINAWYDRAHDAIISRFLCMTNKDVQHTHWKLEEAE